MQKAILGAVGERVNVALVHEIAPLEKTEHRGSGKFLKMAVARVIPPGTRESSSRRSSVFTNSDSRIVTCRRRRMRALDLVGVDRSASWLQQRIDGVARTPRAIALAIDKKPIPTESASPTN
jgi:hypothetical protein